VTQQSLNRLLLSFVSVRTLTNTMAVEPEGSTPPEPKPTASTILCQLHVFLINTVHLAGSVSVFYPFFFLPSRSCARSFSTRSGCAFQCIYPVLHKLPDFIRTCFRFDRNSLAPRLFVAGVHFSLNFRQCRFFRCPGCVYPALWFLTATGVKVDGRRSRL
jgi:hypothetical protein